MRTRQPLLLGGLLATLTACPEGPALPERPAPLVIDAGKPARAATSALAQLEGTVTLTRDGTDSVARPGPLFDGDVVETAAGARAVVRLKDGRMVELQELSRLELGESNDELVLEIGQGVVVTRERRDVGAPGPTVKLTLDTPYGLVRVGAAGLSVNVGASEAVVEVLAGEVTLVGREGNVLALEAGSGGTLGRAGLSRRVDLEPLSITIAQGSGRVEHRKRDARAFTPVNPRTPPALAPGDALRTGSGSVTLAPAKSDARVTLAPGGELGIGESVKAGGAEDLGLELKKGQLAVVMPFGPKRTLRPGDGVSLVAEQGGQLSVARRKDGLELTAVAGDVSVSVDGGVPALVRGGEVATLTPEGVTSRPIEREALQLPTRAGIKLLHPGVERVALTWSDEGGGPWRFTLGTTPGLERPLVDGLVHQPFFNTQAPARGPLYWRVSRGGEDLGQGSVMCGPEDTSKELGRLTNEVPAGPDKTVIYFQDKPPALTFTWKAPERPSASALLRVYRAGQLSAPLREVSVKTMSAQLGSDALGEGTYQWDVTFLDAQGTPVGTAGKMNVLEVHFDNAVRTLVIKAPKNGDPPEGRVAVAGVAPLGVRVTANGQPLALDGAGRFSATVAPLPGARVVFRAAQDGGETFIVRWLGGRGRP